MKIITVLDDQNGMLFNHRRQSQDRLLRERILLLSRSSVLWMNAYSFRQFEKQAEEHIRIDEHFLEKAAPGDYCFVEDQAPGSAAGQAEGLILFRWNREYPGDLFFDISLDDGTWELVTREEFPGSSHEKITMEVYERCR